MDPSQTARLLDAVTVFGGELDSLGTVRGVSMGQGGIWLVTFLQIYLKIMQNPSFWSPWSKHDPQQNNNAFDIDSRKCRSNGP